MSLVIPILTDYPNLHYIYIQYMSARKKCAQERETLPRGTCRSLDHSGSPSYSAVLWTVGNVKEQQFRERATTTSECSNRLNLTEHWTVKRTGNSRGTRPNQGHRLLHQRHLLIPSLICRVHHLLPVNSTDNDYRPGFFFF